MLIPRYLSDVTYEIEELFAFIENDILSDIARRIGDNKLLMTSTAGHQLNRLNALDVQYKEVQKKLAKYLNISESRVSDIISESSYRSVDDDNKIFKKAHDKGFIPEFDFRKSNLKDTILKGISSTNGELRNICKSMASASNKIYGDALDMAYLSVKSGAFSQADAVKNAVKQVAKRGITWIEYDSGAHRRPDSAVRNAVRTGVNQTACRCQDKNFNDMGGNLVEVSSHMGARPEHAVWQGKIYWRKTQYKNYTNFELATGYGSGDGLGGWGCRHGFFPFFEGLSSKAFKHFGLNENKEVYILEQTQRYNERMIREWKRRTEVCKAGGIDYSFEQSKIKEWQGRQKELLDAHPDMKRNYARESVVLTKKDGIIDISDIRISGANDPNSKKANKHAELYYESVRKMKTDYKKIALNIGIDEKEILRIKNYLFVDEIELLNGKKRFDPDYSISESWRRLAEGKNIQLHDMTLIKHEMYERELMKTGLTQDEAHKLTSKKYNYDKEVDKYYAKINKRKKN